MLVSYAESVAARLFARDLWEQVRVTIVIGFCFAMTGSHPPETVTNRCEASETVRYKLLETEYFPMKTNRKTGFTLVEVLIVVVIMAVLAATIIPQFSDSTKDAKESTIKFNLHTLRSQIQLYKSQHDGKVPSLTSPTLLTELINKTDLTGAVGTGSTHVYGPYIAEIPVNPFSGLNTVKAATSSSGADGSSGWLYNAATGEIWVDNADLKDI